MCDLRLQHEVSLLQQQLCESRELIHSLQSELQVYDRMCSNTKANKGQRLFTLSVPPVRHLVAVVSITTNKMESIFTEVLPLSVPPNHRNVQAKSCSFYRLPV